MEEERTQTIMEGVVSLLAMDMEMDVEQMDMKPLSNETMAIIEMDFEPMGTMKSLSHNETKEEEEETSSAYFTVQLKTDDVQGLNNLRAGRRRRIEFSETVRVVLIPSHKEYAEAEKEAIWASKKTIAAMASNNFIEFAAEGWDWRNVIDDEDMVMIEGEPVPVHPIHYNPYLKDALLRGIPYPTPRAVTPPDEDVFATDNDDSGAVSFDCLQYEIERPDSPFLQSDEYDDDSSDDDGLLDIDPDKYLRQRMSRNLQARSR